MGRLFGTDGVRGIANEKLSPELALELGRAGAYVLSEEKKNPLFVIGMDTRISGTMLQDALCAGILSMGGNVIKAGVVPTPAVAYLVQHFGADAGIVISASHNPYEYNGIKFFNGKGFKLDDSLEEAIEEIVLGEKDICRTGDVIGREIEDIGDVEGVYRDFLLSTAQMNLAGYKIVLDCANGASYRIAPEVFKALGAEIIVIGDNPNGTNINAECGSTHPEKLCEEVIRNKAHMGLAFDGDADRLIAVDENGNVIDGDRVIAICAAHLKETGELDGNKATVTIMSNIGFHKYMDEIGCNVEVAGVGDRYVLEKMQETGCVIGGEQSGHIIFLNHTTTGDGILSALQFIKAVLHREKTPSELAEEIVLYPQVLVNAKVSDEGKKGYKEDSEIQAEIKKMEEVLAGDGRVLVRPSGTEPLVRVMLEGNDVAQITELAENLAELLSRKFKL